MVPITSTLLNILLKEEINIGLEVYMGSWICQMCSFQFQQEKESKQLSFTSKRQHFTFTHLHNGYMNILALTYSNIQGTNTSLVV